MKTLSELFLERLAEVVESEAVSHEL